MKKPGFWPRAIQWAFVINSIISEARGDKIGAVVGFLGFGLSWLVIMFWEALADALNNKETERN